MAPKSQWSKKPNTNAQKGSVAAEQTALLAINYDEVQNEEIDVLKAIYMEDYEEVEIKSAWSKTTDRSFKLRLKAPTDEDSLVVLSVTLTATYPKTEPLLEVVGLAGYHERTQKRIRSVVHNRPKQLVGEVMIHSIASEIQDALEDAVLARQRGTLPSLEEERASAEEMATALAMEAEEAETRRVQQTKEEEERMLRQMVDEEVNRRERWKSIKTLATAPLQSGANKVDEVIVFDQPASVLVDGEALPFNAVTLVSPITQRQDEQVFLGKPQLATVNSAFFAVKRLKVQKSRDEIMDIESVLEQVSGLRHNNLLDILTYRIDKLDGLTSQLVICSEYANRGTMEDILQLGGLHIEKARQWTTELLEALEYLHQNGMAHGNLSLRTISIASSSATSPKLADFGYSWLVNPADSGLPPKWHAPEGALVSAVLKRKSDVWDLGVVVVQMFVGLQVTTEHLSPQVMLGRLDFSEAFDELARKMFAPEAKKRLSAFELLPAEFLRTDTPVMDDDTLAVPGRIPVRPHFGIISPGARRSRHNSSNITEPMSRYAQDFTEIGRLGKGGFGEVVKARNKLDGGLYAVKKIKQAQQLLDQVLSEVMLLNRLNHPYVVRYFSTWVENDLTTSLLEDTSSTSMITEETEETSSDGPRMDFGYQSTGGLDFVSSTGYPQIEFGEDEESGDDSGDETEEESDPQSAANGNSAIEPGDAFETGAMHLRKSRSDSRRLPSVLYIQMEYCERRTLRDLIRKGISMDDSWRYIRQITEGLSHIHNHGIIHRDLKPDNIFIDVGGNPKIGDFGLATTSQYQGASKNVNMSGASGGDMTRSVGTALYVAPELRSISRTSYNDKVDMYSLGVMFFEMCETFSTAMERIRALQDVREKGHELPPSYRMNGEKAAQGRLISCLISHKPSERPSSTELLRSDILPLKIEDETIRKALSGLSDARSPYHQKMMSALFAHDSANAGRVKALAWDAKGVVSTDNAKRLRLRMIARWTLEGVFRRHGAEEARRESLFPRSNYYTNTNVAQLLDASGNLLQLPYDLTLPHARQLARQTPEVKRTFVFGSAYRDAFTGGPPRVSDEVDFDIINAGDDHEESFDDSEILKVIDEIVCEMPHFASSTAITLHLNHATILDTILDHCRVPIAQQQAVKETISRLGFHQFNWAKIRAELRKFGLPDTTLDDLQQFDFRDTSEKAFKRLRDLLSSANTSLKTRLEDGIGALGDILRVASQFSIRRKLYIAPLGSVNAKFYERGMLFQCVLERKSNKTVIAAGGRYNSLIHAHRPVDGRQGCRGAVGVSIGLDPIITYMAKSAGDNSKGAFLKDPHTIGNQPKRCDVLIIASGSDGAHDAGIKLLILLWAHGISAELAPLQRVAVEEMEHVFVVTVRHEASSTVRVKDTATEGDETDVPLASLVSHLQQELREKESSKARQSTLIRQHGQHDADRRSSVSVLMSQHRSKKSNKYHIVEAAQQSWTEKMNEWKNAPILAVETRDDVLDSIRETRLGDVDSWRRAVQSAQLNERQYLQQLQDTLSSWRKKWSEGDGQREACIFNFKTGYCIPYDLGL